MRAPHGNSFLNDKTLNFEPGIRERRHKSKENQKLPKLISDESPIIDKYNGNS